MKAQEKSSRNEYLAIRRRHFLWVAFSLVLFGAILYFASIYNDYAEENEIESLDDIKQNIIGILKNDFAIFPGNNPSEDEKKEGGKEEKSKNLLSAPILLSCSVENDKAVLKEPFEVAGKRASNAVFKLANHGKTLYSLSFSSKENAISCRGTLKEGQQKIFVYYCEKI
ncbi:hypothetical protein J6Z19_00340 [bacterium]|nr:hypothetical protein [bacterium]